LIKLTHHCQVIAASSMTQPTITKSRELSFEFGGKGRKAEESIVTK
jgi:hypothetical protein